MKEFDCKSNYIFEKKNKITDTILRMKTIYDKEYQYINNILYSKLHNANSNNITSNIKFFLNFLRENSYIFNYNCFLDYKVISNY